MHNDRKFPKAISQATKRFEVEKNIGAVADVVFIFLSRGPSLYTRLCKDVLVTMLRIRTPRRPMAEIARFIDSIQGIQD